MNFSNAVRPVFFQMDNISWSNGISWSRSVFIEIIRCFDCGQELTYKLAILVAKKKCITILYKIFVSISEE
jgi:hypothetical protein